MNKNPAVSTQLVRKVATPILSRNSSVATTNASAHGAEGHGDHHYKTLLDMKRYSWIGLGVIGLVGFYIKVTMHHHERVAKPYPYMDIRAKPFPWRDGNTGLFGPYRHIEGHGHDDSHGHGGHH